MADSMDTTLAKTRAAQLSREATDLDTKAQTLTDQAAMNRGEDIPGPNGTVAYKGRKGADSPYKIGSQDQKDFDNYASKVSAEHRTRAASLRIQATKLGGE